MGNCWPSKASEAHIKAENSGPSSGTTSKYTSKEAQSEDLTEPNLKVFSITELKDATANFKSENLLGQGGFGCVYKGLIDKQGMVATKPVAVKKLNKEGLQGDKEWMAEVNYLGQLHHPNLVKLIGFCVEDGYRLLVYEFMEEGSLEKHLFGSTQSLTWPIRIKVAVGAAKGLAFLHNPHRPVVHRDFKPSNILLDSNYNSKLSDFGLARYGPTGENTHVSTTFVGTSAYAAPEYMKTGRLTAQSDVYSFGVVLLELLLGRRAMEKNQPGIDQEEVMEWAKPYLTNKQKLIRVMDTRLLGEYKVKEAFKAANLASQCLNSEPKDRPLMTEVVKILEQLQNGDAGALV